MVSTPMSMPANPAFRPTCSAAGADSGTGRLAHGIWRGDQMLLWLVVALLFLASLLGLWGLEERCVPAALAVATLAWFQAVLWFPVGLPGLRIVLATAVISGLIAFSQYAVVDAAASRGPSR